MIVTHTRSTAIALFDPMAHQRVAEVLLAKAKVRSKHVAAPWPSEFEVAVRRRLAPLGIVV